jgi:hypothetical protein
MVSIKRLTGFKKQMNWIKIIGISLAFVSASSWAQESDSGQWDWKVVPYLWAMSLDGSIAIGPLEQDISAEFSDLVSDLDIGGSLMAQIGKGKHAVHFDYTYTRLKPAPTELPAPPGAELSSKLTINFIESAYNYRWGGPDGAGALVVGARFLDLRMRMTAGDLPAIEAGPNWVDYFVGVKTHNAISTNWDFDFYGTIGTGGSDMPWTLQAMFGRRYSNDNRLAIGLRAWGIDYSEKEGIQNKFTIFDASVYGLIIGYEFN